MRFHGLFIGIDRFASPLVNELTCAGRDAIALHALFVDTLGDGAATLLTNEAATSRAIVDNFDNRLASVDEDDFVVISFSGHGSEDHYLVTHDADPDDLETTSISLAVLVELFSHIPASNVLLILDCCFSGGAGARVFRRTPPLRSLRSPEKALEEIANEGRWILTASDPQQEAIEDPAHGHGLLTWFLLEALQGPPEVVSEGRIPIYRLLHYVTEKVADEAASFNHPQRPTVRGTFDGEVLLPVFRPGAVFAQHFPERATEPIGESVEGLVAHGVPEFMVERLKQSIPSLNLLQQRAINEAGTLAGRNVVVAAPTSSGKTMIGELAALRTFARGQRSLLLVPMRAIVNDKYDELMGRYEELGLRIIRATGEIEDEVPRLILGHYDLCLMTYEKASALLLIHPHILRGIGLVVVDEVQMLADESRGANLEFLLTLVKYRRQEGLRPQLVLLSAVIGVANGLERWMSAALLHSTERPVPLREGLLGFGGSFRSLDTAGCEQCIPFVTPVHCKGTAQDLLIPLVRRLVADHEPVIVFRGTKSQTRHVAAYLGGALGLPSAAEALAALPDGDLSATSIALRDCIGQGVAFHNSDLDREERRVVETAFRDRKGVRVIVATTTLAMGVNTPAASVLIVELEHPGEVPYSVAEYKNMVGRAGRLGFAETGKSFIVCTSPVEEYKAWNKYVLGQPEALRSTFLDADPMLLVTRVLATADKSRVPAMSEDQIVGFLRNSFGAYQLSQSPGTNAIDVDAVLQAIDRLRNHGLVAEDGAGLRLTELGRVPGQSGTSIESVLRVVEAVTGVGTHELNDRALIALVQLTTELDEVYMPVHKRSHKERARWQGALDNQRLPPSVQAAVLRGDNATARAKRAAAAILWSQGEEFLAIESSLRTHNPADYAGPVRASAERTRDLLSPVARIAEIVSGALKGHLGDLVDCVSAQLELGIPAEAVPIARYVRRSLTRADYLNLIKSRMAAPRAVLDADEGELARLLGSKAKAMVVAKAATAFVEAEAGADEREVLPAPPAAS
jgi:replicative superfamily II helicase